MASEDLVEHLKIIAAWHDGQAAASTDEDVIRQHASMSRYLMRCRNEMRRLQEDITARRGTAIQLTPEDVDDLPEELKAELSLSDAEQFELDLLRLVEEAGGVISLDVLLVNWYRAKGEVVKRRTMTARIYRMLSKERLFSTPGYKGVYQLSKPDESLATTSADGATKSHADKSEDNEAGTGDEAIV